MAGSKIVPPNPVQEQPALVPGSGESRLMSGKAEEKSSDKRISGSADVRKPVFYVSLNILGKMIERGAGGGSELLLGLQLATCS